MGDKQPKFQGSKEWIGAFEVSFVIQKQLGYACNIQHISSGAQVLTLLPVFKQHFDRIGTPIMIGGGVLAYTLIGISILNLTSLIQYYYYYNFKLEFLMIERL